MKRILIADDHTIVRTGVSVLIKAEYLNVQIDECYDGNSAWEHIQSTPYDLVIMDINMPGTDSVSLLKNIFTHQPKLKVLILTMSSEEIYAKKYLQLGAMGFLNKEADNAEIRKAIASVMNNRKYMSSKLQEIINRDALEGAAGSLFESLSARELEVMTHLVEGKNVSEIGDILSIHISTVSTHKANILQKLKVSNVIELTRMVKRFDIA
ncbi:response regulator transcription factor [Pseudoflavitalea sp. X16]|uniref:response regulator n=1 Tax=Paraflavitalea devenefica TaxID=2716334 RepID=UPI001423303B|nr:response regulator transcription factor [Paraflavitalea devenefica]NII28174.1 response regulator transcription factor [Paraflavitalea devenefica]